MNREQFIRIFVELGWIRHRDEVGDSILTRRVSKKIVQFMVQLSAVRSLRIGAAISIDAFDFAVHAISNSTDRILQGSIICQTDWSERKESGFDRSDAKRYSDKMLEWAALTDIELGLAVLRTLPTDCLGAMPVRHLAALAVTGDIETLTRYRDSFAVGDRLDFVPYIDEGYIARALDFAEHRLADPKWLPKSPRMRV